ncbi:hypothetical protein ETA57_10375 [Bacillus licheniformis]|nr:hypothetical protein CHH87_19030 [Bacillus licheniformis]QAW28962.1 hypothetical protein ETA57_10375 [Bacillus licheniformis]QDL78738.1 hypothetical protein D9Y32_15645 [Bacillus licheniformis]
MHGFFRLPDKILKQVTVLGFFVFRATLQSPAAVAGLSEEKNFGNLSKTPPSSRPVKVRGIQIYKAASSR